MKHTTLAFLVLMISGCGGIASYRQAEAHQITETDAMKPIGTLKLGDEKFAVGECILWGYLGLVGDRWYCRWCIEADGESRAFTDKDGGEWYEYEVQPSLSANTIPIAVTAWRELDGQTFKTGEHGEAKLFENEDHSAFYTLRTMASYELCSNNAVSLKHLSGTQFRIHWTGESFLHGIDGDKFELDAVATLRSVSLSSEVDAESDVDNDEIGRIFATVFPQGDFEQQPAKIERIDEDDLVTISFTAEFIPKQQHN